MAKCIRCGKSILVRGYARLEDGVICTPCWLSLGFKITDAATSTMYRYEDIKDGRDAYRQRRMDKLLGQTDNAVVIANYGQERDLRCTEQEQEIFNVIRSLIDDDGLDSERLELVRKSNDYVSAVMRSSGGNPLDVARIKFTSRAKWIRIGPGFEKIQLKTTEDVSQYAESLCKAYRFNEPYL